MAGFAVCPNKYSPQWKALAKEYGLRDAYALFLKNGGEIPESGKYSDIKLADWKFEDFSRISDFAERYTAMSDWIKGIKQQGGQASIGEHGVRYMLPKKELYLQQSKSIKDGIRQEFRDLSRRQDNIWSAYKIFRGTETDGSNESSTSNGDVQKNGKIWSLLAEGALGITQDYLGGIEKSPLSGKEHDVYFKKNTVIKINNVPINNIGEYLLNLVVHNYLFPETSYKLLGFINKRNKISPVVEQRRISEEDVFSLNNITAYLYDTYKMSPKSPERFNDFLNREMGVGVGDITPENVFTNNGKFYFIDPFILIHPDLYKELESLANNSDSSYQYQLPTGLNIIEQPADKSLDNKIEGFINSLGGTIRHHGSDLVVDGRAIDANAVADVINRTVDVADDKADITTLPEEAAHIYVEWLPKGSKLLADMLKDIHRRELYTDTYEEYKNNPYYQNADGSVNEEKIAKEAIGKLIAGTIVGQYKDQKAKNLWQRLWDWVSGLFSGKDFNAYEVAASDILSGNTNRLDKTALKAAMEANLKGEFYFQLSPEEEGYIKQVRDNATDAQKLVIDKVFLAPDNRVILNEQDHVYTDQKGQVYTSTTSLINGVFENNEDYILNREWGNDFDRILQGIATGKELSEIITTHIPESMRESAHKVLQDVYNELTADGSVLLPQVIVADAVSKVAGSIDLLLVRPDGSQQVIDLKTYRNDRSLDSKFPIAEGSVFYNDPTVKALSKRQKHGIQVATYKKLLSLMGFPGAETAVKYIGLQITGLKTEQQLEGFVEGNLEPLEDSSYTTYADKIVPTEWSGNDILAEQGISDPAQRRADAVDAEEQKKIAMQELDARTRAIFHNLENWRDRINAMKHRLEAITDSTLHNTDILIATMEAAADVDNNMAEAYNVFMEAAKKQLQRFSNYLSAKDVNGNLKNYNDKSFLRVSKLAAEYLDTFQGLIGIEKFHEAVLDTPAKKQNLHKVSTLLTEVANAISNVQNEVYKRTITDNISKDLTEDAVKELLLKDRDITSGREWAGSLGGNYLLEAESKRITNARLEVLHNSQEYDKKISDAGNKLKAAGVSDFKFMMELDKSGKPTGRIINNIGSEYIRIASEVEAPLINDDGTYRQYAEVGDLKTADPKLVEQNIELFYAKRTKADFLAAEKVIEDETGEAITTEDGNYHKYTQKFKEERSQYMRLTSNGKWVPKRRDAAYTQWRQENFDYHPYIGMVFKRGKPTGQTREVIGDAAYFPKSFNVEKREIAADGTKLVDDKYYTLMNPTTDKERAQAAFYKTYTDTMRELVEKLPPWVMDWFQKGMMPALRGNMLELINQHGTSVGALIMSQLKGSLTDKSYMSNGSNESGIPIMFISSIQDELKLKDLEQKLTALIARKDTMPFVEYSKQFDHLKDNIKKEAAKIKGEEINPDLVEGLKAFVGMTENYNIMTRVEDELLTLVDKIKKMDFVQEKGVLGIKKTKEVAGEDSKTLKKLVDWMEQNLYSNENFTKDMAELAIRRLQNATSILSIPFNVTGMLNNAIVARINNRIDAVGSDFFRHGALNRAIKNFDTQFIPGFLKTKAEFSSRNKSSEKYSTKKAGSKYEALVEKYHMVKHNNRPGTGKVGWLAKIGAYAGYEMGEFMVQSQVGIAITDTVMLKNSITGEQCSLYDAHEFDPNTGTLKLKDGFNEDHKTQADVTHRIWKTNERIHGNYDPMEKIMLEKYWVGKLVLQFHKWVWPNFQARFQRSQYEEGLGGGMEVEGRYITLAHFLRQFVRAGISIDKQRENWAALSIHQKNNLKKDAADMMYVAVLLVAGTLIKAAAEGIPDDDPYLKKMANWMQYQSDRGVQELSLFIPAWGEIEAYNLVKNPFAVTSSLRKFATLLGSTVEYPFLDEESRFYKNGAFRGQLKVEKQFRDIIPLYREMNQWTQLDVQKSFYIR